MSLVLLSLDCMYVIVKFFLLLSYYCLSATYMLSAGLAWGAPLFWKALEPLFTHFLNKHIPERFPKSEPVIPNGCLLAVCAVCSSELGFIIRFVCMP